MSKLSLTLTALVMSTFLVLSGCGGGTEVAEGSQDSAEAVVEAFYDMFAQNPDSALALVDPDVVNSDSFQRTWEEISTWEFTSVEVVGFDDPWVEVEFAVLIDGEEDGGIDEVEVVEKDGMWWIVGLPS